MRTADGIPKSRQGKPRRINYLSMLRGANDMVIFFLGIVNNKTKEGGSE